MLLVGLIDDAFAVGLQGSGVVRVTAVDVGDGPPIAIGYSIVSGQRYDDIFSLLSVA